ncbi:MAG: helicase c-terminal, partial [Verrucomicrobiales bacterium]|nr:helicase c-terminal [Verrucomicrobiales bacterium]
LKHGASLLLDGPSLGPGRKLTMEISDHLQNPACVDTTALDPNAELLLTLFINQASAEIEADLIYTTLAGSNLLQRILRNSAFRPYVSNAGGMPYEFMDKPLKWQLLPPETPGADYELTLTDDGGNRIQEIMAVLRGIPNYYITPNYIFEGPAPRFHFISVTSANKIPAEALETPAGFKALKELKLEPPAQLKEKVKYVPLSLMLACRVEEKMFGKYEECVVESLAVDSDHKPIRKWNGHNWIAHNPAGQSIQTDPTRYYDTEGLEIPRVFDTFYWDFVKLAHTFRITRSFPEEFVAWVKSLPPTLQLELHGELADLMKAPLHGQFKVDLQEAQQDWFDLKVILNVSDTTLTKEELDLLLAAKGKFVRLPSKGWRRLELQINPGDDEALATLGLSANELSPVPQRLHSLQLAKPGASNFIDKDQFSRIQARAAEIKTRVTPPLPSAITAELRPYQLEGFHFLAYLSANSFGGILADDMGLGKTVQTLAWIAWLLQNPPEVPQPISSKKNGSSATKCTLIVCPKSVMDNWKAETERFAPSLRTKMWSGSELAKLPARLGDADLHVINYSQLRSIGEELASIHWMAIILDEGQYIKNPTSLTALLARKLKADHRLILSGTPIENRLMDLWSLMEFALPGILGNRAAFGRLYGQKEDMFARKRLAARVRPFLLRRTKSQVAKDLPDRIEEDLFCEMEGYQLKLYKAELKHAQQILLNIKTHKQLAKQRFHFLTSLLRLRQICCHPALYKPSPNATSAKLEALTEQLEPLVEEGQKILIFSQFVEMLDIIQKELDERKWPYYKLIGATENRGELVKQFQATEGPCIFLISLKAGGSGLNLTAASYVILFDPWWNPAVENQAIDRTHRIGQLNKVIAYRLLIKNSIEEKIRLLQKQKSAIVQDVLGEENFTQNLTLDDLKYILSDSE